MSAEAHRETRIQRSSRQNSSCNICFQSGVSIMIWLQCANQDGLMPTEFHRQVLPVLGSAGRLEARPLGFNPGTSEAL